MFFHLQTMMIEGADDSQFGNEREWYYGNIEKERIGPKSFQEVRYQIISIIPWASVSQILGRSPIWKFDVTLGGAHDSRE